MEERDIKNVITHTINNMPIPWEKLWNIFQKIIQLTQKENENNIIQKNNKLVTKRERE